jgi:tryptophan synthase alpha chain
VPEASDLFARRPPGQAGLAVFLNAGDPPLDQLADVTDMLDDCRVDCLELAVPFPDSPTDGPVIRRSAQRALAHGTGFEQVLEAVARIRPTLDHLRIVLLADWSYTVKPGELDRFVARVAASGADGLLLHGLPPRLRWNYYLAAHDSGLPIVTTCYRTSNAKVMAEAAAEATAYLYLVARYGRSGAADPGDLQELAGVVASLRAAATRPVAVGFGVRSADDVARLHDLGADAAVIGTAAVACVERAILTGRDVVREVHGFVRDLRPAVTATATDRASGRD